MTTYKWQITGITALPDPSKVDAAANDCASADDSALAQDLTSGQDDANANEQDLSESTANEDESVSTANKDESVSSANDYDYGNDYTAARGKGSSFGGAGGRRGGSGVGRGSSKSLNNFVNDISKARKSASNVKRKDNPNWKVLKSGSGHEIFY